MPTFVIELEGWPERGATLTALPEAWKQETVARAGDFAMVVRSQAVQLSPLGKTQHPGPRFRDSWTTDVSRQGDTVVTDLGNVAPHATLVLEPTPPHRIPRAGNRLLAWEGGKYGAGSHFAMYVKHPGTPGNPVGERTNEALQPRYEAFLAERAQALVDQLAQVFTSP